MFRRVIVSLSFVFFMAGFANSQNFKSYTSQIFFNANLQNKDTSLITYFKTRSDLSIKKDTGWTMYPSTNEKGEVLPYYKFVFTKHPYFNNIFKNGTIVVLTSVNGKKIIGLSVSFSSASKTSFASVYKEINSFYRKYSTQVVKRDVSEPFEVTKYISRNKDFVIITKGENDNEPYIHIAYNYQGYRW